jgi:hypothetical protein
MQGLIGIIKAFGDDFRLFNSASLSKDFWPKIEKLFEAELKSKVVPIDKDLCLILMKVFSRENVTSE